jgi:hypothetical protein
MLKSHIEKTTGHQHTDKIVSDIAQKLFTICKSKNILFKTRIGDCTEFEEIKEDQILLLWIKDPLPGIEFWKKLDNYLQTTNKQLVLCPDSICDMEKFSNIKVLAHPALLGINYPNTDINSYLSIESSYTPTRRYNCFMHRIDSVRQSWFYLLHQLNLLDQGYVSFLLFQIPEYSPQNLSGQELFDWIHKTHGLNTLENFEKSYQELRESVPYQNFEENNQLNDKILDSKYSLVLDTNATDDHMNQWFMSEKVYRTLMTPTIDLLFLQKGATTKLKSLGFITNTVDLEVDSLDWVQRQSQLLNILVNDSVEYNFDFLREKALHNYNLLIKFYQTLDSFYTEVFDILDSKNVVAGVD